MGIAVGWISRDDCDGFLLWRRSANGAGHCPNPAKPEPNRIRSTHQTSALGGTVEAAAERALPRAPRRGALVLRPDHRHRYFARGVLCKRDDGIPVGAADPHLRLSAICRAAS